MKTPLLSVFLISISGLLWSDCSQPGTIAYYPLSGTTENLCSPTSSTDIMLNGSCSFAASPAGCESVLMQGQFSPGLGTNPTTGDFLSVTPSVLAQLSGLSQYSIQFTYNQDAYGPVGNAYFYTSTYVSNPPSGPPLGCVDNCYGDTIVLSFNNDVAWYAQNGQLSLLTDEALQPGVNSTITCTYDGTNYYIYMDGKVAAGPIPDGNVATIGGQPFPQIPNFSIASTTSIDFEGAEGCFQGACTNGYFSNVQLSTEAFVPNNSAECGAPGLTPSPTPTPTGQCPAIVTSRQT
jgi:hypothetical protein